MTSLRHPFLGVCAGFDVWWASEQRSCDPGAVRNWKGLCRPFRCSPSGIFPLKSPTSPPAVSWQGSRPGAFPAAQTPEARGAQLYRGSDPWSGTPSSPPWPPASAYSRAWGILGCTRPRPPSAGRPPSRTSSPPRSRALPRARAWPSLRRSRALLRTPDTVAGSPDLRA